MDQGSVSVCSCRAFTYYCHNAYEHRGAHRSCDGSEGSQHRRGVCHFFQFYIAGSPGKQRHHQTADGKVPDHVKGSRCPKRGIQGKEGHADVADDQGCGSDHKKPFDPHLIVHLSCQRADHCSGQGARQCDQTGDYGGVSHNALYIERHHYRRAHHHQIQKHTGDHAYCIVLVFQDLHIQERFLQSPLADYKEDANYNSRSQRKASLYADQSETGEISDSQGDAAKGNNAFYKGNKVKFLILKFQHIFKNKGRQNKGKCHDHQNYIKNRFPSKGVDHQSCNGGCNNRSGGGCQPVGSHHGSSFFNRIDGEDHHLSRRH